MAISLDDIPKKKKVPPANSIDTKKRKLRPWESFDQLDTQTRTVFAQEAVKKARDKIAIPFETEKEAGPYSVQKEREETYQYIVPTTKEKKTFFKFLKYLFDLALRF